LPQSLLIFRRERNAMSLPQKHSAKSAIAEPEPGARRVNVRVHRAGEIARVDDLVAEEIPVALIYNDQPYVVMMATPCDLEDFALGFSLSEGIVAAADEILDLRITSSPTANSANAFAVHLRIPQQSLEKLMQRRRNLAGRSGCGLCGAETIAEATRMPARVPAGLPISQAALIAALQALRGRQHLNAITGATHAAAWADACGDLLDVREDVGRHNALDKLLGTLIKQRRDLGRGFAIVTSRASYEMVLKTAMLGIPVLVAISAPTAYAIQLAEDAGLTLIGFARGKNCVIYACAGRVENAVVI
jgi:FdhD protein